MIPKHRPLVLEGADGSITLQRNEHGVLQVSASSAQDVARGLGYGHAHDRLVQMEVVRLFGQGRLAECLRNDEAMVAADVLMRRLNFAKNAREDTKNLSPEAKRVADAYADGVNRWLEKAPPELEFLFVGHRPGPWSAADSLLTVQIMGYLGLADTQGDLEKFIVQAYVGGAQHEDMVALFPNLHGFDPGLLDGLELADEFVPQAAFSPHAPVLRASNNWVLSGARTASGVAMLCNDPHLEINRLPAVWYEAATSTGEHTSVGATMPGVPFVISGRCTHVAFGLTYGFADQIDYFIEECDGRKYRVGDKWRPIQERRETIFRKGDTPLTIAIYSTHHGLLEGCPGGQKKLLSMAYAMSDTGAAASFDAFLTLQTSTDALAAQDALAKVQISGNWVIADKQGAIAYQQSGTAPRRSKGCGLAPRPGWDANYDWDGFIKPSSLSRQLNPPSGFIATANNHILTGDATPVITAAMSHYRLERIEEVLAASTTHTVEGMQALQLDHYSRQFARFLPHLGPLLPPSETSKRLKKWDGVYRAGSEEATHFELALAALREVFFGDMFGNKMWRHMVQETSLVTVYAGHFDDFLLADGGARLREHAPRLQQAIAQAWVDGAERQTSVRQRSIFFEDALPLLDFRHPEIPLCGSSATVAQANIYRSKGRDTSFAASWRAIAPMEQNALLTSLAGGASGRFYSPWYNNESARWSRGEYKWVRPRL